MGRPQIKLDGDLVEKFAQLGCKTTEIADYFGCSTDTIQRRFAAKLTKGRADLKMSLRRWQLESAKRGNPTMLIWLGKQILGQTDKNDVVATVTNVGEDEEVKELYQWLKDLKEMN